MTDEPTQSDAPQVVTRCARPVEMADLWPDIMPFLTERQRKLATGVRLAMPYCDVMELRYSFGLRLRHPEDLLIESVPVVGNLIHRLQNGGEAFGLGETVIVPREWHDYPLPERDTITVYPDPCVTENSPHGATE